MKKFNKNLQAFTLTELMVVLVIIGILILLALPTFDGLFMDAYSLEAKNQLKYLQSREQIYYQKRFSYAADFNALGFEQPKTIDDGGEARYLYEIVEATKESFLARATAVADFDRDGTLNVWEINQEGEIREVSPD